MSVWRWISQKGRRHGPFWSALVLMAITAGAMTASGLDTPLVCATAVAVLMMVWWVTEAVPLGVTSLVPVVLFPLLGVTPGSQVSLPYFNDSILIFFGMFLIAEGIEKHGLHERIALSLLSRLGVNKYKLVGGFVFVTAFLSTGLSNTAAASMVMPITDAVYRTLTQYEEQEHNIGFKKALVLGVAYAATFGGMATLTGTGPNLVLQGTLLSLFGSEDTVSFYQWFLFACPLSVILLGLLWAVLCLTYLRPNRASSNPYAGMDEVVVSELHILDRVEDEHKESDVTRPVQENRAPEAFSTSPSSDHVGNTILEEYKALPPMTFAQKFIAGTLVVMALLFFTRAPGDTPGWASLFPSEDYITDGTVSMMCALLLFIVPTTGLGLGLGLGLETSTNEESLVHKTILDWTAVEKIPWNVIFLLGGGFAISTGFLNVGLSPLIARTITAGNLPLNKLTILSVLLCTGVTNFVSNMATANLLLPSLACVPPSMPGQPNPIRLLAPLTLACSVALMLPVGICAHVRLACLNLNMYRYACMFVCMYVCMYVYICVWTCPYMFVGTPPNAIAFASKAVTIRDLVYVGGIVTVLSMVLILTFVEYLALSWAFDSKSSENIIEKCQV